MRSSTSASAACPSSSSPCRGCDASRRGSPVCGGTSTWTTRARPTARLPKGRGPNRPDAPVEGRSRPPSRCPWPEPPALGGDRRGRPRVHGRTTASRGTHMPDLTHRWEPVPGTESLHAAGSPFELAEEDVLGVPTTVFANRLPHLRAQLEAAGERIPELPYFVYPDRDIVLTYADVLASVARIAEVFAGHGVGQGDVV